MTATLLRAPGPADLASSQLGRYLRWLRADRGVHLDDYAALHAWSVGDLEGFWGSVRDYFAVGTPAPGGGPVLGRRAMPGAEWFPGATFNYAGHALAPPASPAMAPFARRGNDVAVVGCSQTRPPVELTVDGLRREVARVQAGLRALGVGRGDRVVGYLPNIPETLVAFLATAGLGAVWASCAPEFGAQAVVDRFGQVQPTVLLAVAGYRYGEKDVSRLDEVAAVRAGLPSLRHVVDVPYGAGTLPDAVGWAELGGPGGDASAEPLIEPVPFDHPLYVLFSSGTTGAPKAIVHGHGGILLEHVKNHMFSWDLHPGDRLLWFTTTAWMMWNALVSTLLVGASMVMLDGNPVHPDLDEQWRLAAETGTTVLGASPGYLMACRKAGLHPARAHDLGRVRQIAAAGSPLPVEGFRWLHDEFGPEVLINVGSGGTDVCTGIVQGSPLQPVWEGEMSGPALGVAAAAFDDAGRAVVGELGELVITEPMPSMPVGFWGDDDGARYRAAYFDVYPGVWRHGDWIRFSADGSCVITGRSDATLNRGGVRLGTAEFYRVVEELPEVDDSLVVHLEDPEGGNGELLLYVVLRDGAVLDDAMRARLAGALRAALSPRHVPDRIVAVPAVPRTRTGKKLELPVKRILAGADPAAVLGADALADPSALDPFVAEAGRAAR